MLMKADTALSRVVYMEESKSSVTLRLKLTVDIEKYKVDENI